MAYSKQSINAKYDKLRAQLKKGEITQANFKAAANRLYNLYHKNKGKGSTTTKPAATIISKPTPPKSKTGADVLRIGGGNVRKGTLKKKPQGKSPSTSSNFMSSSSTYTGSNLEKPKPKRQGPRAGSRATVNRKPTPKAKPTAPNRYQRRRRGIN